MSGNNRGRYVAQISDTWRRHAETLPGLRYIGTVTRGVIVSALAQDADGRYFAVNGRQVSPLVARKVQAALEAAGSIKG